MKICIVTHNFKRGDGQGRVNYEVAQEAILRGHEVTLVASHVSPDLLRYHNVRWIRIYAQLIPIVLVEIFLFALQSSCWLWLHRSKFDLIQTNGAATSVKADVNAVHFVHTCWMKSQYNTEQYQRSILGLYKWFYARINSYFEKQSFHGSHCLIAVSEKIKQELISVGVPASKIQVILNGVELGEFYPRQQNRSMLGLPSNVPLALFVGDIRSKRKNLDTVLKALVDVPELHLAIAGDVGRSPFPEMAQELRLQDRTHFLGFRRDVADLMRAADFFVFPSRYEACTLALLEAMASGLPVITAASTGGAELIDKDCGVVLSEPENITELVNTLNILTQDMEQRKIMGEHARVVAQSYSWHDVASKYLQLFEQIVHQRKESKEDVIVHQF